MTGFAIESTESLEVVAAWCAPKKTIPAVVESPGWYVLGEYYLPKSTWARLDATGSVSDASLTMTVRLWDVEENAPVGGPVRIESTEGLRVVGANIYLHGNRTYQVQAECTGGKSESFFGVAEAVTITDGQ